MEAEAIKAKALPVGEMNEVMAENTGRRNDLNKHRLLVHINASVQKVKTRVQKLLNLCFAPSIMATPTETNTRN